MLKSILNLEGAEVLQKEEQAQVLGGNGCHSGCQHCLPTHCGPGCTIWTCLGWGGSIGRK